MTLSRQQAEWGQKAVAEAGLAELAEIRHLDYRDVAETGFDAVSSIGLTEHIGRGSDARPTSAVAHASCARRAPAQPLHHPAEQDRAADPPARLHRPLRLPGRRAAGRAAVIGAMHDAAGLEVRHEENLREHYAKTCAAWCDNLDAHWDEAVREVGEGTARVWALYLAGSRLGFERQRHPAAPGARGEARREPLGNAAAPGLLARASQPGRFGQRFGARRAGAGSWCSASCRRPRCLRCLRSPGRGASSAASRNISHIKKSAVQCTSLISLFGGTAQPILIGT